MIKLTIHLFLTSNYAFNISRFHHLKSELKRKLKRPVTQELNPAQLQSLFRKKKKGVMQKTFYVTIRFVETSRLVKLIIIMFTSLKVKVKMKANKVCVSLKQ